KFTPWPSQLVPCGYGEPGHTRTSAMGPRRAMEHGEASGLVAKVLRLQLDPLGQQAARPTPAGGRRVQNDFVRFHLDRLLADILGEVEHDEDLVHLAPPE